MDPLAFIFIPGAVAMAAALAAPLFVAAHLWWRRKAKKRNADLRCGRCERRLPIDSLFLFSGRYVCPECADKLRKGLGVLVPAALGTAVVLGINTAAALLISSMNDGPSLKWWLDDRWIAVTLPSLGLGLATLVAISLGRRANVRGNAAAAAELPAGESPPAGFTAHEPERSETR